jgi:hypothetical protein
MACMREWRIDHHGVTEISQAVSGVSGSMDSSDIEERRHVCVMMARKLARELESLDFWEVFVLWLCERQGRQRVMRAL